MKKSIFLAALMLISTGCFAQKSAIRTAKNLAMQETPDFDGARAAIKPALENEETKNLAETWYVAGLIGNKQNENIWLMGQMGQTVDNAAKGAAVEESINYWLVADSLAMVPVYDKKGKPKFDLKTRPCPRITFGNPPGYLTGISNTGRKPLRYVCPPRPGKGRG